MVAGRRGNSKQRGEVGGRGGGGDSLIHAVVLTLLCEDRAMRQVPLSKGGVMASGGSLFPGDPALWELLNVVHVEVRYPNGIAAAWGAHRVSL